MKIEELTDSAIDYILKELADRIEGEAKLTKWEESFVQSVIDQWERVRRLSERQKEILGGIWDKQP